MNHQKLVLFAKDLLRLLSHDTFSLRSPAEFDSWMIRLFSIQYDLVHPYRKFCDFQGVTPPNATSWKQIPAIPTRAFKELVLTSIPPGQETKIFYSSGTTLNAKSAHFHYPLSLQLYESSVKTWFQESLASKYLRNSRGIDM